MFSSTRLPKTIPARALLPARTPTASRFLSTQAQGQKRKPKEHRENTPATPQALREPKGFSKVFEGAMLHRAALVAGKDKRPLIPHRYYSLMDAVASNELHEEALALMDDMVACGLALDTRIYNFALKACGNYPKQFRETLYRMDQEGVARDGITYARLIHHRLREGELELALQDFHEMIQKGFNVPKDVVQRLVLVAARGDHPRLALDILQVFKAGSKQEVRPSSWVETLSKSVELHWEEGVRKSLKRVKEHKVDLDQGLTTELLQYSARIGDLALAESMLKNLKKLGVQPQEQHLAPFIEIYVKKDNLDGLFDIFDQMKQANIAPTERSAQCLADGLWATQNQSTLRKIYDILETRKDDKRGVAVPLINAVLRGTGWCSDKVDWWIKLYEDLDLYRTQPNIRTFDALLQLCYNNGDEPLSQRIYDDLMSRGATASIANPADKTFKPTARTYKLLSMIAVKQKSYEAAFHWLEESKAAGFTPAPEFYVNLIRRCAWRNDPRWIPAREEMKSQGYDTAAADKFLRERGLLDPHGNPEPEKRESPPPAEAKRPARKPRRMIRGLPRV